MRATFVLLHRYVGLAIAGFLIVAGLTGSILVFRSELDAGLNPELLRVAQMRPMLSPSQLTERAERADPTVTVSALMLPSDRGESASAYVIPKDGDVAPDHDQLFIDPGTGAILGRRLNGEFRFDRAHLIPFLYSLHYSLTLPGRWGMWLMGGVALAWMVDCLVGFYLTLPRGKPFWKKWRPIWTVKRTAGPYRLNLDLHRAASLWLWTVLFLMALTSVSLNLNSELFRPVLSALLPTSPSSWQRPAPVNPPAMPVDWNLAVSKARAEAVRHGWNGPVSTIYADRSHGFYMVQFGRPHQAGFGPSAAYVSAVDGRILSVDEAGGGEAGDVVAGLIFPIHSGQVAGLPGRILICITGLVVAMLSATGVYLWWKKRAARVVRRRKANRNIEPLSPSGKLHAAE